MTIVNKGKLLKTAGWITVGVGFYLVTWGTMIDDSDGDDIHFNPKPPDDSIIEAEWFEIKD